MKNKKLFKTLLLILLVVVAFTWVIPGTSISQSGALELEGTNPEGLLGIFGSFDIVSSYFFQNMLLVLFVGMFYGVINKTGAYKEMVDKVVKGFKKKEEVFLILSILFFILFPALTNIYFFMFLFVPFFMHVLKELGYKKNLMLLATVGSVLIGLSGEISSKVFANAIQTAENPYVWVKVGFLVLASVLTVLYALKFKDTKEKDEDDDMLEMEKRPGRKIDSPSKKLTIVLIVMFVFFLLGFVPWGFKFLTDMNTSIMGVTIGKLAIFKAIFGGFNPFGAWFTAEFYTLLALTVLVVSILYRLTLDEIVDGLVDGIKAFIVPALLVGLMSLVTIFTLNSGFIATVLNLIVSTGNAALVALGSLISAPFVADHGYIANYGLRVALVAIKDPNTLQVAFISQITYGVVMLVVPTSAILVAGLGYTQKDYKSWVKFIWKLAVMLLILVFIAVIISTLIK